MNVSITPSVAAGEVSAPPSKSVAHRLLICAGLSEGASVIDNIGTNDDITATISCLRALGAEIEINGTTARVTGASLKEKVTQKDFDCNESGSTLRFMIPVSMLFAQKCRFTGRGRLMQRPQSVYKELFTEKDCYLRSDDNGLYVGGELKSGVFRIPGDVSSQFFTGLMFALPLLEGDSEIILTTELQSAPYVDITIDALKKFGVIIEKNEQGFYIKGNQKYKSCNLSVEGDWSNAAFLEAFNLAGGSVNVNGLNPLSFQGDKICQEFYKKLCEGTPVLDISQYPDLGPVLMVCAVLKNGAKLTGTDRLKIKESDRGTAMAQEFKKFGVNVELGEDYIIIPDCVPQKPTEAIDCHNDHRIAMSFSVLCSVTGGILKDAQCVNKSYPDFFKDIKNLGIQYEII
ncbi:MAG: 3-phosphoshikimate 1-carboxyvinyltransferase [Clostridia bacterium]|nr:3-phosphoshikimate 1-carboxyvinyltransferase [Clostridia bacterium]